MGRDEEDLPRAQDAGLERGCRKGWESGQVRLLHVHLGRKHRALLCCGTPAGVSGPLTKCRLSPTWLVLCRRCPSWGYNFSECWGEHKRRYFRPITCRGGAKLGSTGQHFPPSPATAWMGGGGLLLLLPFLRKEAKPCTGKADTSYPPIPSVQQLLEPPTLAGGRRRKSSCEACPKLGVKGLPTQPCSGGQGGPTSGLEAESHLDQEVLLGVLMEG